MRRAAILALLLGCGGPALAQVAPAAPAKPVIAKPSAPKPPVVPAPPAASAKLASLKAELGSVDKQIAALKAKQSSKDSISELNRQDMVQLEEMMKRKNQLESMISNTMKSASE